LVLWQVSHEAVVATWFADLPVALEPLWQVAQLPGVTVVWLKFAGRQTLVLWQVSQDAVVTM
jgi:hypothetical protein